VFGELVLVVHGEYFAAEDAEGDGAAVAGEVVFAAFGGIGGVVEEDFVALYAESLASRQKISHYHLIIDGRPTTQILLQPPILQLYYYCARLPRMHRHLAVEALG